MGGQPAFRENLARLTVQAGSLAGRVLVVLEDLEKHGRMSRAEAQTIMDILWHPAFPNFFRDAASAPVLPAPYPLPHEVA